MGRTEDPDCPPDRHGHLPSLHVDDNVFLAGPTARPSDPPTHSRMPSSAGRGRRPPFPSNISISPSREDSSDRERRRRDRKKQKAKLPERKAGKHEKEKVFESELKKAKGEKKRAHRKSKRSSEDETSDSQTSSDYRKKRRLLKAAKKLLKQHGPKSKVVPMEPAPPGLKASAAFSRMYSVQVDDISADDYFAKSIEFAMWLKEAKGLFFSNLSSEETHKLFVAFIEVWNASRLSTKYYQGIKDAPRTAHKWGIKLDSHENALLGEDEDDIMNGKKLQKLKRKKFNQEQEVLVDELLPKAMGQEALIEKKALRRKQARAREDSPEIYRERDVMGGGHDFRQRLAQEWAWRQKKAAAKSEGYMEKKFAFEEREAAAMNQFKAMVNMSGRKIVIPKRNDSS